MIYEIAEIMVPILFLCALLFCLATVTLEPIESWQSGGKGRVWKK
jgi:hypothetical protein